MKVGTANKRRRKFKYLRMNETKRNEIICLDLLKNIEDIEMPIVKRKR